MDENTGVICINIDKSPDNSIDSDWSIDFLLEQLIDLLALEHIRHLLDPDRHRFDSPAASTTRRQWEEKSVMSSFPWRPSAVGHLVEGGERRQHAALVRLHDVSVLDHLVQDDVDPVQVEHDLTAAPTVKEAKNWTVSLCVAPPTTKVAKLRRQNWRHHRLERWLRFPTHFRFASLVRHEKYSIKCQIRSENVKFNIEQQWKYVEQWVRRSIYLQ